jgi:Xaa-Pro aminopeptidase
VVEARLNFSGRLISDLEVDTIVGVTGERAMTIVGLLHSGSEASFVRNDYVAYLNGYAGHQSRLAILGEPTDEQQKGYSLTLEVHRRTIERCRAGVTAGEIYAFVVDAFKKEGIDYTASHGTRYGPLVPSAGACPPKQKWHRAGGRDDPRRGASATPLAHSRSDFDRKRKAETAF